MEIKPKFFCWTCGKLVEEEDHSDRQHSVSTLFDKDDVEVVFNEFDKAVLVLRQIKNNPAITIFLVRYEEIREKLLGERP